MKTKLLFKHGAFLIVSLLTLVLSIISTINLSEYPIHTHLSAMRGFVQMSMSCAGLCASPVFMLAFFIQVIKVVVEKEVGIDDDVEQDTRIDHPYARKMRGEIWRGR